jgi:hypothetical protein
MAEWLPTSSMRTQPCNKRERAGVVIMRGHFNGTNVESPGQVQLMQAIPAHVVVVAEHRPVRAWIDTSALVARGVLVRQDVTGKKNRLVGYTVHAPLYRRRPDSARKRRNHSSPPKTRSRPDERRA